MADSKRTTSPQPPLDQSGPKQAKRRQKPDEKSLPLPVATPLPIESFLDALNWSEPRPDDTVQRRDKKNYAERLSNAIAVLIANRLRSADKTFLSILPNPDGTGRESTSATGPHKKLKKTDVRYSTADTGLELLVSVKTLSFRDAKMDKKTGIITVGRYTKNMVRNDHELRAEAMDLHDRHPYAVLIAMIFLPFRACDDGGLDKSSFAHAVMTFRARAGRAKTSDPNELFERVFIGLYEHEGDQRGDISLFDVMDRPPKKGRPRHKEKNPTNPNSGLLLLDEAVAEIIKVYGIRNRRFIEWDDEDGQDLFPILEPPEDPDGSQIDEESEA